MMMLTRFARRRVGPAVLVVAVAAAACGRAPVESADGSYTVALSYRAPGEGPAPNFSPKGTQVALTAVAAGAALPSGAIHPARTGRLQIGPAESAWVPVLVTADAGHPADLCRLFVDKNRNGDFTDDGPGLQAEPTENAKTKAWWTSFNKIELSVPYDDGVREPFLINVWIVRDGALPPAVLRYSRGSWRSGTVSVRGVSAVVAAMDANNDAVFTRGDTWSVIALATPDAEKAVLTTKEARETNRMMFVDTGSGELVLEFGALSPDGRSLTFRVVDRPTTKAEDRAGDDPVADERGRARTTEPVAWRHDFDAALAEARQANRLVFIDFETTWCGPCHTMDEWIWTDAEVARVLRAGYVGLKLDGDVERALVERYGVKGYPTMIVVDAAGTEVRRLVGYQTSAQMVSALSK